MEKVCIQRYCTTHTEKKSLRESSLLTYFLKLNSSLDAINQPSALVSVLRHVFHCPVRVP